eukprot:TRINITY_DN27131_c0_g1_i1.p1 TRINITY_DN27131_c0_g1~~TRINITY_DN27131_c0_g1_i1.p1  ORF type:complete len:631 (-),score=61.00 TRINITY_DN27131_c0_g1_i1:294-2186(-)
MPPFLSCEVDSIVTSLSYLPKRDLWFFSLTCKRLQQLVQRTYLKYSLPQPYITICDSSPVTKQFCFHEQNVETRWEMNLLAITRDGTTLFAAKIDRLYRYDLSSPDSNAKTALAYTEPTLVYQLQEDGINQIHCGLMVNTEVVVLVTQKAKICVLSVDEPKVPILCATGKDSTWSIDVHPQGKIAVGSNAYEIRVWDLSEEMKTVQKKECKNTTGNHNATTTANTADNSDRPFNADCEVYVGHAHNVPCVAFSPCGEFLASTSIDGTVRIWDVEHGGVNYPIRTNVGAPVRGLNQLFGRHIIKDWMWGVTWIPKDSVQVITTPLENVLQENQRFLLRHLALSSAILEGFSDMKRHLRLKLTAQDTLTQKFGDKAENVLASQYLLLASTTQLFLTEWTNVGLRTLAKVSCSVPNVEDDMERLAIVKYMPELSAVVATTQGNGCVQLFQLVQNAKTGHFYFVLEHIWKFSGGIAGLTVHKEVKGKEGKEVISYVITILCFRQSCSQIKITKSYNTLSATTTEMEPVQEVTPKMCSRAPWSWLPGGTTTRDTSSSSNRTPQLKVLQDPGLLTTNDQRVQKEADRIDLQCLNHFWNSGNDETEDEEGDDDAEGDWMDEDEFDDEDEVDDDDDEY